MRRGSTLIGCFALLVLVLAGGCGNDSSTVARDETSDEPTTATSSAGQPDAPPTVDRAHVEDQITEQLTNAGEMPDSVHCDGDLVGVVQMTQSCSVVLDETLTPVTVEVTSVDGDTVNFKISLDDASPAD